MGKNTNGLINIEVTTVNTLIISMHIIINAITKNKIALNISTENQLMQFSLYSVNAVFLDLILVCQVNLTYPATSVSNNHTIHLATSPFIHIHAFLRKKMASYLDIICIIEVHLLWCVLLHCLHDCSCMLMQPHLSVIFSPCSTIVWLSSLWIDR